MPSDRDPTAELDTEVELLRLTGQGDRRSFAEIYERFCGVIFSTAYRVLNNQQAAEDVVQDVFIQIWEKAPLYNPERGKPLTWAVTLTRNKAIDRLRSVQRRHRLHDDAEKQSSTLDQFDERNALDAVNGVERAAMVRQAISRLNREQRESIELAFFSGLTQTEIAERLTQPLGTIKARIRRGMMRLREFIAPQMHSLDGDE